jgi:predicted ATPase/DNA-binding XRE family transcriptional regulator
VPDSSVLLDAARFGVLLREHRRAVGLTQEQLAERAGVSPRSISELERGGAHIPRRDTITLLARALGLSGATRELFETLVEGRRRLRPTPVEVPLLADEAFGNQRRRHNLPRLLTSCVGREAELSQLAPLLASVPLLTLVGAGGVGKTRLAQELVRQQSGAYADGCWLVELAGLDDPLLLADTVAAAVGLHDIRAQAVLETLIAYLREKHLLLVLDNCEHIVEACAELAARLLSACPSLHVLATSREPLAVGGEVVRRVLPLEIPDMRHVASVEQLKDNPAVRLFVERAQAVNQGLELSEQNAAAVARVCVCVDGIPLALELAAARTRMLSIEQLADRLDQHGDVLAATNRAAPAKHRTMRATLDWSHALLSDQEQVMLRRLAVFASGWTLATAEQVCCGDGIDRESVLDLLAQLVDRSMVLVDARDTVARYRLLEPIRQYALERLEASSEATSYRTRHATAFFQLVLAHQAGGAGPDEITSLDRLEIEHDNLRTALAWALAHDQAAAALRCSAALFRFWERRGHFQEGCAWLEQALRGTPETAGPERSWALNALAFLRWRGGDPERAAPTAQQALAVSQAAGAPRDVAQALLNLGMIAYMRNQSDEAVAHLEQSVAAARQHAYLPQLSLALTFLGRALMWANGPADRRAAAVLHESLSLARRAESMYAHGHALATLGDLMWGQGNARRALPLWREALLVRFHLTDRRGIAGCLERLALVLAASDRFEAAAWLFGAAEAQHRLLGIALRHDEELDHEHLQAITRQALGDQYAAAFAGGQMAAPEDAVDRAMAETRSLLRLRH